MEGGWQLVDCLELIDLDFPVVVQLAERKSVRCWQLVEDLEAAGYLESVDWLPLAEQELVSYLQLADCSELAGLEKLVGSAVTGL